MHITNKKLSFDYIYSRKFKWNMIFTLYPNDFWRKRKMYNFDPYNVFLAIATNIPQRLKTGFVVLQSHIKWL